MKLLRNFYLEILVLFYYGIAAALPVVAVLRIVNTLPDLSLLFFAGLIAAFLSLMGLFIFCTFLSAVLQGRQQSIEKSVESFYR